VAAITAQQVSVEWDEGSSGRAALLAVKNVSSGDTLNVGTGGAVQVFSYVKSGIACGTTVIGTGTATVTAPTTLTMPSGLSNDSCFLLVFGCAF
jgi:hypothetical protein